MKEVFAWGLVILSLIGFSSMLARHLSRNQQIEDEKKTAFIESCLKDDHKYYQCVILFEKGKFPK